jgi:hypothetical protein
MKTLLKKSKVPLSTQGAPTSPKPKQQLIGRVNVFLYNPMGLAHVVEALVLGFTPFKVQGSNLHGCKQFFGTTPSGEKPAI